MKLSGTTLDGAGNFTRELICGIRKETLTSMASRLLPRFSPNRPKQKGPVPKAAQYVDRSFLREALKELKWAKIAYG